MSIIRDAARKALEGSANREEAVAALVASARRNKALREALLEGALENAAYEAVDALMSDERRAAWSGKRAMPCANNSALDLSALAEGVARSLLDDFRLPDGTPVGAATREQVIEAATAIQEQGETMLARSRWLFAIAERLKPGEIVSKRISEAQAQELQRIATAKKGIAA